MRLARGAWVAVAAALLAAGCVSTGGDVLIGERSDARTRAKAHTDLAGGYYELGNMGVALEELKVALKSDSDYAPAYNLQGLVYLDLKENALAQRSFERALDLAPNDPNVLHNWGWFLCQTGREKESIPQFMKAIQQPLYRTPSKSYAAAGQCSAKMGKDADATAFFERALRLDPDNPVALLPYAEQQYHLGNLQRARTLVGRYNQLTTPTPASLWLAARIERRAGNRAAAQPYEVQLRQRYPGSKEYQDFLQGKFQ